MSHISEYYMYICIILHIYINMNIFTFPVFCYIFISYLSHRVTFFDTFVVHVLYNFGTFLCFFLLLCVALCVAGALPCHLRRHPDPHDEPRRAHCLATHPEDHLSGVRVSLSLPPRLPVLHTLSFSSTFSFAPASRQSIRKTMCTKKCARALATAYKFQ